MSTQERRLKPAEQPHLQTVILPLGPERPRNCGSFGLSTWFVRRIGSNLKTRIEFIMRNRNIVGLSLGKQLVLEVAVAALVVPVVFGVLNPPAIRAQEAADWQTKAGGKQAFDVASVKKSAADAA